MSLKVKHNGTKCNVSEIHLKYNNRPRQIAEIWTLGLNAFGEKVPIMIWSKLSNIFLSTEKGTSGKIILADSTFSRKKDFEIDNADFYKVKNVNGVQQIIKRSD